jgi:Ca-activated chloride channel family protein
LHVNVNLVLVPVTVTDQLNRPVLGLNKDDFTLFEGEASKEIRYFSAEDSPLSIGVLLDVSKSMTEKIDLARAALGQFFENGNPADDYFVITFSDRPALLADSTTSVSTIRAKLTDVKPDGQTALLDAIYMGMHKLRSAHYQRKALLIISDGGDNHSRFTPSELKNMVMESDVQIYGIGIYSSIFHSPEEWSGKRLLTQITEATGGHTITVKDTRDLPDAAGSISTELRNQYVLGYAPLKGQAPGWRKIKVRVTPRDKAAPMQLYWRRGYMGSGQ